MLPKSPVRLKVGRAVPSAPSDVTKIYGFRTSTGNRGALGTARPTALPFGPHALTSAATLAIGTFNHAIRSATSSERLFRNFMLAIFPGSPLSCKSYFSSICYINLPWPKHEEFYEEFY